MPPGMEEAGVSLKLLKALYELSESPKLWYNLLVNELLSYGFNLIDGSRCIMRGHHVWIIFYVDDGLNILATR